MKKWNFDLYAIKNETKDDIEYWNFFTDNWVKGPQFNMDCVQPQWTAENQLKGNKGKLVKINIIAKEIKSGK